MNRRKRTALAVLAMLSPWTARAQFPTDGVRPPTSPRLDYPFATDVDRLPGPPRSVGELPVGESQPPSTLPGRQADTPPRFMGESPELPPVFPPAGPTLPRFVPPSLRMGTERLSPLPAFSQPGLVSPPSPARPESDESGKGGSPDMPGEGADEPRSSKDKDKDKSKDKDKDKDADDLKAPVATGRGERPRAPVLDLAEVLVSAERRYPMFLASLQERAVAMGDVMSARGVFDTNLNADSRNWPLGYYQRSVQDVFVEQPLMNAGGKVFGGYRIATGLWPVYYNYLNTLTGGAFVGGFELPILKNRAIDAKRAKLMQTEIERRKVEPTISKERISLIKNASKSYFNWVAAGRTYAYYRDLVRVANYRNTGLEKQMREGVVRPIDLVDFRKILISRQQQEITARRRFEAAGIELSMFLRDERTFPMLPDPARLPYRIALPPPPDPARYEDDFQVALRLRPEILSVRLLAQKAQIERSYAVNQLQPSLNLYVYMEQDVGQPRKDLGADKRPYIMETSLLFDVPLQRRAAKGRIVAADATIRQLVAQARYTCDQIRADVADAQSGVRAASDQLEQARENLKVATRLEDAEKALLREGSSTVLFLNLREQATSDARIYVIEAEAKYLSAIAEYRAALGLDALPGGECG